MNYLMSKDSKNLIPEENRTFEGWSKYGSGENLMSVQDFSNFMVRADAKVTITPKQEVKEWGTNEAYMIEASSSRMDNKLTYVYDGNTDNDVISILVKNIGDTNIVIGNNEGHKNVTVQPGETKFVRIEREDPLLTYKRFTIRSEVSEEGIKGIFYLPSVSKKESEYLTVLKIPLENGFTRIRTWGGEKNLKYLYNLGITNDKNTTGVKITNNSTESMEVQTNVGSSEIVSANENKDVVIKTDPSTDKESILGFASNGDLDITVSRPYIVSGHEPEKNKIQNLIPKENRTFEGWSKYGSGINCLLDWDFTGDMSAWRNFNKTEQNTVIVGKQYNFQQRGLALEDKIYIVRVKAKLYAGNPTQVRLQKYDKEANNLGRDFIGLVDSEEYKVVEKAINLNNVDFTSFLSEEVDSEIEIDWIQITPIDNQHLVVEIDQNQTVEEWNTNRATRIRTWGGNHRIKLRLLINKGIKKYDSHIHSIILKNNGESSVTYDQDGGTYHGNPGAIFKPNETGTKDYLGTIWDDRNAINRFIRVNNKNDNLDIYALNPSMVIKKEDKMNTGNLIPIKNQTFEGWTKCNSGKNLARNWNFEENDNRGWTSPYEEGYAVVENGVLKGRTGRSGAGRVEYRVNDLKPDTTYVWGVMLKNNEGLRFSRADNSIYESTDIARNDEFKFYRFEFTTKEDANYEHLRLYGRHSEGNSQPVDLEVAWHYISEKDDQFLVVDIDQNQRVDEWGTNEATRIRAYGGGSNNKIRLPFSGVFENEKYTHHFFVKSAENVRFRMFNSNSHIVYTKTPFIYTGVKDNNFSNIIHIGVPEKSMLLDMLIWRPSVTLGEDPYVWELPEDINRDNSVSRREEINALLSTVRETYLAVELLDIHDRPIKRIEGELMSGSLSIDGGSVIRRTGQFTARVNDDNYRITESFNTFALNKRVKIDIGVKDLSRKNQKIVWFSQGVFVMTRPSIKIGPNGHQITIQVVDKMALHDGTVAGNFQYHTRVDTELMETSWAQLPDNEESEVKELVKTAREIAHSFSTEDSVPIEIFDELDYVVSKFLSIIPNGTSLEMVEKKKQLDLEIVQYKSRPVGNDAQSKKKMGRNIRKTILSIFEENFQRRKLTVEEMIYFTATRIGGEKPGKVIINDIPKKIKMPIIYKGEPAYKMVDFTFPEELVMSTNNSAVDVYEACNNMLGNCYEYFYDRDGNFVFQEKRENSRRVPLAVNLLEDSSLWRDYAGVPIQFDFEEYNIIENYDNNPDWSNIKNDITIWGGEEGGQLGYRMVITNNPPKVPPYVNYVNMEQKVNRQLEWQEYVYFNYIYGSGKYEFVGIIDDIDSIDKHSYLEGTEFIKPPVLVKIGEKEIFYTLENGVWEEKDIPITDLGPNAHTPLPEYYTDIASFWMRDRWDTKLNKVLDSPGKPRYHINLISGDSELNRFAVETIGRRPYAIIQENVKELFPTRLANKMIYNNEEDLEYALYDDERVYVDDLSEIFVNSQFYGSVNGNLFDIIKDEILDKTYFKETVNIRTLPLYFLEPNESVRLQYERADVKGNFIVNKISYNFEPNSMMTVNLTKTRDREGFVSADKLIMKMDVEHSYRKNGKQFKETETIKGYIGEQYLLSEKPKRGYTLQNPEDLSGEFEEGKHKLVLIYE